jgi:three-Cys-motif partner protein
MPAKTGLCPTCGAILDRDASTCRVCGEDLTVQEQPTVLDEHAEALFDRLGTWSEVKHEILEEYVSSYTTILARQRSRIRRTVYADAFAGAGMAKRRETDELVPGSPLRVLAVDPPFDEYHFIELDRGKARLLEEQVHGRPNVRVHVGDCNSILRDEVLPRCRYEDFARGLCLLDPYGLTVEWKVLQRIGEMKSVEVFLNFMVVGANRNVLWGNPDRVPPGRARLMDRIWGDNSWRDAAYHHVPTLFEPVAQKATNEELVEAYRQRLMNVAGFKYVPKPIPMKNTHNATIYYLFFASPNATGAKIIDAIFNKYRTRA